MKFTKMLIFTALIFIFSIPVFCQNAAPLTASTASRIVELFEFALDGSFDRNQGEAFVRELAAQWKSETNAPSNYTKLLELYDQVKNLPEANRRQAQTQFQQAVLSEIQKNPNNSRNRILLSVYNNAHGVDFEELPPEITPQPTSGNVPTQLVGKWMTGKASNLVFQNSQTGASTNASGIQVLHQIYPNGRYEYATRETHTMYSCESVVSLYKTGHIEMNGAQITFVPESGKFTSEDSCNRQNNYTKPVGLERETYNASVQRDEYGTKLCLQGNGVNGCAYKRD